jgi:hypothetical protein
VAGIWVGQGYPQAVLCCAPGDGEADDPAADYDDVGLEVSVRVNRRLPSPA